MTASRSPLKLAIIAGEPSGDLLGADLITALRARQSTGVVELVGVGGDAMAAQGLHSLFDYHDLSIVGISAIVAQLPKLLSRIRQTTNAIVEAAPDMLIIIDSPAFSHRVAKRVRKRLPALPVVNYVCPSVWAWRPQRAAEMNAYVDHILSILPFEAEIVSRLGGPPLTYVGHRLASDPSMHAASSRQKERRSVSRNRNEPVSVHPLCLVLPGSRGGETRRLLPDFAGVVHRLAERMPNVRFHIPTLPRLEKSVREATADWTVPVEITTSSEDKWQAFSEADVALAASGTVLLELSLAGVPCISTYKLDALAKPFMYKITAWTVALPNFIADYPIISEYINENIRPGLIARRLERLLHRSTEREEMLSGFDQVRDAMQTDRPPAEIAADVVSDILEGAGKN